MKKFFFALFFLAAGCAIGLISVPLIKELQRPALRSWHSVQLDAEFRAEQAGPNTDLNQYLQMEEKLFQQLQDEIVAKIPISPRQELNRFYPGSWSNPLSKGTNWNRSFMLENDSPKAGVLLLHGLSDSPYSLRTLGQRLHESGCQVLGLRLPGHGTAPSGLTDVTWQDFAAAVRLGMRHLHKTTGDNTPLFIAGYSNGAALALEYTLSVLDGEQSPLPTGLLLISPAVSVSPLAGLAKWKIRFSQIPGLHQLAWLSVDPEYDPYKYNSFPMNGGVQIHELTLRVAELINRLDTGQGIPDFPRTLAFISAADATIPPAALADNLMEHLAPNGHRMVLFDINREADTNDLIKTDPLKQFSRLFSAPLTFDLLTVTNSSPQSKELVSRERKASTQDSGTEELPFTWPRDMYALSHVALPFPPEDPVYGRPDNIDSNHFSLGTLEPRGEKNLLRIPVENLMRLRYNPFYQYIEEMAVDWVMLD